ncbi:MAG: hypothetical protein HZB51_28665 [Chloroflexi bacterium]|nr:hypothetical protein [Chloroflexota bacterium]
MSVLLVTYDLKKPGQDYADFLKVIRDYPYARLSESSYAIATTESPTAVYNKLRPYQDDNDQLYIVNLKSPWMGYGPKKVNEWLDSNLPT